MENLKIEIAPYKCDSKIENATGRYTGCPKKKWPIAIPHITLLKMVRFSKFFFPGQGFGLRYHEETIFF